MAVIVADIQAMPGLSGEASADVSWWLDLSDQYVGDAFGAVGDYARDRAVKLWVAHALVVAAQTGMGAAGAVTARRVGDVATNYGSDTSIGSSEWLGLSNWGRLYLQLARVYGATSMPIA